MILFLGLLFFYLNGASLKKKIVEKYPNLRFTKYLFKENSLLNNINNDYNIKFLPLTQFEKISFIKKPLNFDKSYYEKKIKKNSSIAYSNWGTFFIETYKDSLLTIDYLGNISKIENFLNYLKKTGLKKEGKNISTNLDVTRVTDTLIVNNKIYIAYIEKKNKCNIIGINSAEIELNFLKFDTFFRSEECSNQGSPGRMQFYNHEEKDGILLSTIQGGRDTPDSKVQDDNSIYGKILFINLNTKDYSVFSKGHRAAQGLYAEKRLILSTEHGPYGGDEINKIIFKKNYGWPTASYGERYNFNYENKPFYKKNHKNFNFEEPIFSFTKGIGISELIRLPNNFSNFFQEYFIVTSLMDRSLYFTKFDDNFNKVLHYERVFLGERIRDIKYFNNFILLALEENGELGILFPN
jgi:hypothetical protein